jgi:hypothetical protein
VDGREREEAAELWRWKRLEDARAIDRRFFINASRARRTPSSPPARLSASLTSVLSSSPFNLVSDLHFSSCLSSASTSARFTARRVQSRLARFRALTAAVLVFLQIGVARKRGVDIIANETSNRQTPYVWPSSARWIRILTRCRSLVAFGVKQRALGEAAKTQETSNFRNTIGALVLLLGRTLNDPDVQEVEKKFQHATLIDVDGTVGAEVRLSQLQIRLDTH